MASEPEKNPKTLLKSRPVEEVNSTNSLPWNIYHESGTLLHAAGEPLTEDHLQMLKDSEIESVLTIYPNDPQLAFKIKGLKGFYRATIYIKKTKEESKLHQVEAYKERLKKQAEIPTIPSLEIKLDNSRLILNPARQLNPLHLDRNIDPQKLLVKPSGKRLRDHVKMSPKKRKKKHVDNFIGIHHESVTDMRKIFTLIRDQATPGEIPGEIIGKIAERCINCLVEDKNLLLNLVYLKTVDDYIIGHSVNVCLLAINIATAMNYNPGQVLEIAYGALLQDIGMARISIRTLNKKEKLNAQERLEIQRHPLYSLEILQRVKGIPESAGWIAYHSHERLDGSGYIKQRTKPFIHQFAKIVAVADVYEALISSRSYREAKIPYVAMEEVIRMGNKKKLDPMVIKAFLRYICLYPIGSWVELSDGSIGKVVASNEDHYDRPVVNIFYDALKKKFTSPYEVNLLEEPAIRVNKAMDPRELENEIMEGFK